MFAAGRYCPQMFWTIDCSAKAMQPRPDFDLIAEGQNRHTQALSELFERHYSSSIRVAHAILGSDEERLPKKW